MVGTTRLDKPVGDFGDNAEIVTPSDTTDFTGPVSIVAYNGTSVRVKTTNGQVLTIPVVAGLPVPVKVVRVYATGTDASSIVAYW